VEPGLRTMGRSRLACLGEPLADVPLERRARDVVVGDRGPKTAEVLVVPRGEDGTAIPRVLDHSDDGVDMGTLRRGCLSEHLSGDAWVR